MKSSTQRVIKQYLRRCAGILDYPPKLEEEIWVWVREQYASLVLGHVEDHLSVLTNTDKARKENERLLKDIGKNVRILKPGQEYIFTAQGVSSAGMSPLMIGVRRNPDGIYQVGVGPSHFFIWSRTGHEGSESVIKEAETALEDHMKELASNQNKDDSLIEYKAIQRECLKYTNHVSANPDKRIRKQFSLDLSGWRYTNQFPDWKEQLKNFPNITVIFSPKYHTNFVGQWVGSKAQLYVDAPWMPVFSVAKFQKNLEGIRDTLQHELQHVSQTLLQRLSGAKINDIGVPSKSIRTQTPTQKRNPQHALLDTEFYTRLGDEVRKFNRQVGDSFPRSKWSDAIKIWVGISPPKNGMKVTEFFKVLKSRQPDKWKKAVKEFTKAVEAKINIPRES